MRVRVHVGWSIIDPETCIAILSASIDSAHPLLFGIQRPHSPTPIGIHKPRHTHRPEKITVVTALTMFKMQSSNATALPPRGRLESRRATARSARSTRREARRRERTALREARGREATGETGRRTAPSAEGGSTAGELRRETGGRSAANTGSRALRKDLSQQTWDSDVVAR